MKKINLAIAGGPCTGKSTLAAALFSTLKESGYDYDYVSEQSRALKKEFLGCRSPFDRFYIWRQQEREELRSTAKHGFITDSPLFHLYIQATMHAKEPRDTLAVRELLRMCFEISERYHLIVIAANVEEIPFKKDKSRRGDKANARCKHNLTRSYVEHFLTGRVIFVKGTVRQRVNQVLRKVKELHAPL